MLIMRKIILTSLFFCLAITTVLAQITPDGTTTSTSDVSGVTVIGIAAPDSNGLSNNTYSDFDISSSGVKFLIIVLVLAHHSSQVEILMVILILLLEVKQSLF